MAAPDAAGGGQGPAARPALPAAQTRLTPRATPQGGFNTSDEDIDEMADNNPLRAAAPFLEMELDAARSIVKVKTGPTTGVMIAAELWSLDLAATRTALTAANLIEHKIRPASKDAVLARMYRAGVLDSPHRSALDLTDKACTTALYDRSAHRLGAHDIVEAERYTVASPCPDKLAYLRRVSWLSLIDAAREIDAEKPT